MTLVEVLVALVVLGLMATLLGSATKLAGVAWTRAEQRSDATEETEALRSFLHRLIATAYPAFASDDPRDRRVVFQGTPDMLTVIAPLPGRLPDGAWAVVHLRVGAQGQERALMMDWRLDLPAADGSGALPPRTEILLGGVSAVRFAYFGAAEPGQPESWLDRWSDAGRLPALVRVKLQRNGPDPPPWPDLIAATRVTAITACVYDAADISCRRTP